MALSTIQKIDRLGTDSDLLHGVVHGPARGPGSVVETEGGGVITMASAIANVQDVAATSIAAVERESHDSITQMQALANAQGYQVPVQYAAGILLATVTQTVEYNGHAYAPIVSALPFVASGVFEADKFRLIQGVSQADLASPGATNLMGYAPIEHPSFNISVKRALDETVDLRTKFGLTGRYDDDQTAAWNDLVTYINSLSSSGGTALLVGCYHITGPILPITKGLKFKGLGFARSRMFFDNVNGLVFDLANQRGTPACPTLEDLALTTNANFSAGYKAVQVLPWTVVTGVDPGMSRTFQATRVYTCSEAIWNAVPQTDLNPNEWAVHYDLGQLDSPINLNDSHIDDCIFSGSYLNMVHTSQTGAVGVRASNATGLRLMRPKMFALSTGTNIRGQSEGSIVYGGTHVNLGYGVVYSDSRAPADNHAVTDSHFKVHFRGVQMQDSGSATLAPHNQSYLTNVYVLEKDSTVAKPAGFIGIEWRGRGGTLSGCKVWTPQLGKDIDPSVTTKTGLVVGRQNNQVESFYCDGMHYALNVVSYDHPGYNSGTARIEDFVEEHTAISFLAPGSLQPTGTVSGSVMNGDNNRSQYLDALYSYKNSDGTLWQRDRPSSRAIFGTTTYSLDMKTSTSTALTDSRIVFSGGDAVGNIDNKGSVTTQCDKFWSSATEIGPNTDNVATAGWPSRRYKTVYAGTGSIDTSDARYKTPVRTFTTDEMAAAQELAGAIGYYRFLDAVEEKGGGARLHCGMTVQRAIEIMQSHGLEPLTYGFICHDAWDAQEAIYDGEGNMVHAAQDAGDIYSFRVTELLAFITGGLAAAHAAIRDVTLSMGERLTALEAKADPASGT